VTAVATDTEAAAYRLVLTVPSGESEGRVDVGGVGGEQEADLVLEGRENSRGGPWLEATLCRPREGPGEAWRGVRRRSPTSPWQDVHHWGEAPDYTMPAETPLDVSVEAVAAWLRRAGAEVTYEGLRAAGLWPGRQERFPGGFEPDPRLRLGERQGADPLESALCLVLREGAAWGAMRAENMRPRRP